MQKICKTNSRIDDSEDSLIEIKDELIELSEQLTKTYTLLSLVIDPMMEILKELSKVEKEKLDPNEGFSEFN
jgi:hypothetical protein